MQLYRMCIDHAFALAQALNHVLANREGRKVAVLVNDMSEVNIDAQLVKTGGAALSRVDEKLVEMQNGCICCTLREDLLVEVGKLAREGRFDYLLIESTGISEPLPVAETFTFEDEAGKSLGDVAQLDTMVTVVDAKNFLVDWQSEDDLRARQIALGDEDERSISDLLVEQVEFADVLVIAKPDLVSPEEVERLEGILRHLNPEARIVHAERGKVPLDAVLGTGRFDFEKAARAPGWLKELRGEHVPETVEYGIASFVYRSRTPFHPARFWALLQDVDTWGGVLRSKGFFWLASRMDVTGLWSQAGGSASYEGAGMWYAALPRDEWPEDEETRAQIQSDWQEPWGDRRQELVFIGVELDEAALRKKLDAALLTPKELDAGPKAWRNLSDPFPDWMDEAAA
ncbi:MAG: zinc metallochaperone GTPase ZigA [Polyangiaceae bacterium]|nr:zinc metallochaperone GTPase ZigA [Polyangiaceae bacterium]